MKLISITGTIGAGKGTIADYLKTKGFEHYSVREFIAKEVKRRNLVINRTSLVEVANELRQKHSPSFIIQTICEEAEQKGKDAVVESIRTEGELKEIKKRGGIVLAIDADPQTRYNRIINRGNTDTDSISFETFLSEEKREASSIDSHKSNINRCIELADYKIMNNGGIKELQAKIDEILNML